jgi:hypothetical protein
MATNGAAMSADLDFEDEGILGAREVVERLSAPRAAALLGGQDVVLGDGREVRVIASFGPGPTGLLATRSRWRRLGLCRIRSRRRGGRSRLGLAAEELLLPKPELRWEPLDFGPELGLAL